MSYDDWKTTEPADPYERFDDDLAEAFEDWDPAEDEDFVAWCDEQDAAKQADYPAEIYW